MRLFLAINLPADRRRAAFEATAALRRAAPDLSWATEARLHLTVKFLGEQSPAQATAVADAMTTVALRHRQFGIRLGDVGAFPNFRRPRVVWMGVDPDPRLELLHHDVEVACESLGFSLDGRPFRPHLTLARVRDRVSPASLRRLARAGEQVTFAAEAPVESVDLMHSVPGPTPRYERLHAAPLRPA